MEGGWVERIYEGRVGRWIESARRGWGNGGRIAVTMWIGSDERGFRGDWCAVVRTGVPFWVISGGLCAPFRAAFCTFRQMRAN